MSRVPESLRRAALLGTLMLAAVADAVEPPVRQVLVLQSFNRGNMIIDQFTGNLRVDLEQRAAGPVNFVQVVVGPAGLVGPPEHAVVDFVRSTFEQRAKPDLIISVGGPAAVFARKYRSQLFPETPLLLAAVDQRYLGIVPLGDNDTAVAVDNDFPRSIDEILQLLPETRQVLMLLGTGALSRFWRPELEAQFRRFEGRVTFIWTDNLSYPEILRRSASLPPHSAIFYLTMGTDAAGATYADERVIADLRAGANAPMFGAHSVFLGAGIVGGSLLRMDDLSRSTADAAARILDGAAPREVKLPVQLRGLPAFDWRQLERWGIAESRLPAGSLVLFRAPSLWSQHKTAVLIAAGALGIQALLIVGLLVERRARRRAEIESRRNLALATDASRRHMMSALSSSITHELAQPLTSMINNGEALQMMVARNSATRDEIAEVLADIHAEGLLATQIMERHRSMLQSRELQKKPLDIHAVIRESLALVSQDMTARRIESTIQLSAVPCIIDGDSILLQQVIVNLVVNAMDAMDETPLDRRRITIGNEIRAGAVEIFVRDTGAGLPANVADRLFTPFVTTKAGGLGIGLAIARTIVEAHGGTITARNNPDHGATFIIILGDGETPKSRSAAPARASTVPA